MPASRAEWIELSEQLLEDLRLTAASLEIDEPARPDGVMIGNNNSMLGQPDARRGLGQIQTKNREALRYLQREPFVAQVTVEENNEAHRIYLCRATPPSGNPTRYGLLASYRSPLGRLAERDPDEEVELSISGRRREFRVVQQVLLTPRLDQEWDAMNNRIAHLRGRVVLRSLRDYLGSHRPRPVEDAWLDDFLTELVAEPQKAAAAAEKMETHRREARLTLALRDQAILDRFQGEVFRLPLGRRILLSGPPGTGKTTTLIKRLAQKRELEYWEDEERDQWRDTKTTEISPRSGHRSDSWVLFTPTPLLRLYLKEVFTKEQVPASDDHVKLWDDERLRLGRDVLNILKSATSGQFTLRPDRVLLLDESSAAVWHLYERFVLHLRQETVERYEAAFRAVTSSPSVELRRLTAELRRLAGRGGIEFDRLYDLIALQPQLAKFVQELGGELTKLTHALLDQRRDLLERLAENIDLLLATDPAVEEDDDTEEDLPSPVTETTRKRAYVALSRALQRLGEQTVGGRRLAATSRHARIIEFLGERRPSNEELTQLGKLRELRTHVSFLAENHRTLLDRIPKAFQRFRRRMLAEEQLYRTDVTERIRRNDLSPPEMDVVILTMLRSARILTTRPDRRWEGSTPLAMVRAIEGEYRTQVLVDEATDFSAVALACMMALSNPLYSSFFASGDLRQRMSRWGVCSHKELLGVSADFEIREIDIGYRQSLLLTELSRGLACLLSGPDIQVRPFYQAQPGDVAPILREQLSGDHLPEWLAGRIAEVERALAMVPSIAIFVGTDDEGRALAGALSPLLEEKNLTVRAYEGGQAVGIDREIRIFSAKYIKGLEFEAVFFVDLDSLAAREPDLYRQILYVGATRATRYLGVTCCTRLPPELEPLRSRFVGEGW